MSRLFARDNTTFISLGDITAARFQRGNTWTFLAFFRIPNSTTDDHAILNKGINSNNGVLLFKIDAQTAPTNIEVFLGSNFASEEITGGDNIELNTWYLISISCAGTNGSNDLVLHLVGMDGTFLDDGLTGTAEGDPSDLTADIEIGVRVGGHDDAEGDFAYYAYIDEVLTKPEILQYLYNPVQAVARWQLKGVQFFLPLIGVSPEPDWSGKGNNGTVTGTIAVGDNPPVQACVFGDDALPYAIAVGQPTMRRWGGVPHMNLAQPGRSW